jgi:hypothetical protein
MAENVTKYLKTGLGPTTETLCMSNTPQTINSVQHNIAVMNQPLSQTLRDSELQARQIQ